ncbi:MAG TPA: glycosyltransferase family 4 protein [Acidisarcina sp.]
MHPSATRPVEQDDELHNSMAINASETVESNTPASTWRAESPEAALRVVHIIKHCGYGNGSVHVAVDLACVQAQAGYDVTFVSSGGTFEPMLAQHTVRHLTLRHDQGKPFAMLRTALKLAGLARRTRPHVLHAHMMSSAVVGYIASKLSGVPLVTTVHNSFDRHSLLMRLGRRVVAVSDAEREHLLSQGYNRNRLVAVMNAPDKSPREEFMHNDREITINKPCIMTTSALHQRKGVFDVIDACSQIFAEHPQWTLYIAGEGPDREKLEQQVSSLGLKNRVIFLGFLPAPRPLLDRADIFVLASYADPCSLAVGEARAAGCAIVATNVGGTPEMLEFGRAGRLVFPGKPKQLAAELRRLMADDNLRERLRRASLLGSEVFDVHRLVRDYEAVYRGALGEKSR